jgi:hypothetical protein
MDDLLRGYFRAEMPDPWPTMTAPEPTLRAPSRPLLPARQRWFRIGARLALAASIGFILVAYLALARNFPQVKHERPGLPPGAGDVGLKKMHPVPQRVTTPRGQEALLWEDNSDSDRIIIKLEMINPPKGTR